MGFDLLQTWLQPGEDGDLVRPALDVCVRAAGAFAGFDAADFFGPDSDIALSVEPSAGELTGAGLAVVFVL